jgi:transposase
MIQAVLPIFPPGANEINNQVGFQERDGRIYYFHGQFPVFSHEKSDINSFRYITAQFHLSGHVKQNEIVEAFGVPAISVKRSVKRLREEGIDGFSTKRRSGGTAHVLTKRVLAGIQKDLDNGMSTSEIAKKKKLKANTIQKAIASGKLKKRD